MCLGLTPTGQRRKQDSTEEEVKLQRSLFVDFADSEGSTEDGKKPRAVIH